MSKASYPHITTATRGANNAARAAAELPTRGAKHTRAELEAMQAEASTMMVDSMRRRAMIAEAAYFKAMERGFSTGCEMQDWLQAEQEVDRRLM